MIARQPVAWRPLVLLALAVVAAHALLLSWSTSFEAPRPPGMKALVTRVVNFIPEVQPPAPVQRQVDPDRPVAPRVRPPPRASRPRPAPAPMVTPVPLPEPVAAVAAASAEPAVAAASAPPPLIDSPPPAAPTTAPAAAIALAIPGSVRLKYAVNGVVKGQRWSLNGQLLWRHDGSRYEARLEYSAPLLPSRAQQSTGSITPEGLAPQRFSDKSRTEQATHFVRDKGTLVFSNNAPELPLPPGAQDRLSVFLQLASMLAAAPAKFPPGTEITMQTVGTRDAQAWVFTVEGEESLDLPGGRVATRKLVRQPRGEYDIRVELWLGTGMDYVPVRIRLTQSNGDYVDQQWTSTDRS
ncbi:DUF3108 domain-containing protein [Caenimonas terrae]|uniref:DUF3108 domain-containing protein n=1 Tax=Caenimonas terrae TaxID=696074 RepID=A0ABW0N8W7_9BURK